MRLSQHPYILYVDDNLDSCEMLALMLQFADDRWRIETVSDANEAARLIAGSSFDLYILDYAMPKICGVELCRQIREIDTQTPILFYSGMTRPIDRETALAAGATEYLIKPNDLDKLIEIVRRLLKTDILSPSQVEETRQAIAESKELLAEMARRKDKDRDFIKAKREILKKAEAALRAIEPPKARE